MDARFFVIFILVVITATTAAVGISTAVNNQMGFFSQYLYFSTSPLFLNIDQVYGQDSDLQMPSFSFSSPYSDLPTGFGDTLSGFDSFENELSDSVKEKISL